MFCFRRQNELPVSRTESHLGSGVDHVWVQECMISGSGTKPPLGPGPNRVGCRAALL